MPRLRFDKKNSRYKYQFPNSQFPFTLSSRFPIQNLLFKQPTLREFSFFHIHVTGENLTHGLYLDSPRDHIKISMPYQNLSTMSTHIILAHVGNL